MADETPQKNVQKDTGEYSATKAPETKREAEEKDSTPDPRLKPGGTHGSAADVGMSGIDEAHSQDPKP